MINNGRLSSGAVLQLCKGFFFPARNVEEFRLSSSALNQHARMTFSIMRSQYYVINIDIHYQHFISQNKLVKACWIILTELFLNTFSPQKRDVVDCVGNCQLVIHQRKCSHLYSVKAINIYFPYIDNIIEFKRLQHKCYLYANTALENI